MTRQRLIGYATVVIFTWVFGSTLHGAIIGWNFSNDWPSPTVQGDGIADGFDQWTDSIDEAAPDTGTNVPNSTDAWVRTVPINAPMVSVSWTSANMWAAGAETNLEQDLYRVYLDDGGAGAKVTVTGLSAWLAASGDGAYRIRFYRSTDRDGWGFSAVNIHNGTTTDPILETVAAIVPGAAQWDNDGPTGPLDTNWDPRDIQDTVGTFSADTISFTMPGGGNMAGSLAAFKITSEPVVFATPSIGFNFVGNAGANGTLGDGETAGAPGLAQRHWNNLTTDWQGNAGAVPAILLDSNGQTVGTNNDPAGGVSIQYDSGTVWSNNASLDSPDHRLMKGYLDDANPTDTATQPFLQIANIPYSQYKVVLYVDGDQGAGGVDGGYWIEEATADPNTDGVDLTNLVYVTEMGDFAGTYQQVPVTSTKASPAAGNYIVFEHLTLSDIKIRGLKETGTRGIINAVQLVQTPEPSSLVLAGVALLGLGLLARRRR